MQKCSIIIASFNEDENLKNCLNSLRNIDYPKEDYEIIVVDNNSEDNTRDIVALFSEVLYLNEDRRGAACARNKGIASSKHDILVFIDADIQVTSSWLSSLIDPFQDARIGAVGGAILPANKKSIISRYLGISLFMRYHRHGPQREVKGYPSCNLAVRKDLAEGGFDASTFNTYAEDKDLCWRIIKRGYKIVFSPKAILVHNHPENLSGLFELFKKSAAARSAFSIKYPASPDALLFNLHLPLLYILVIILLSLYFGLTGFLLSLLPALIYVFSSSILAFIKSRAVVESFLVKPVLDILSVYIIYLAYHRSRLK